MKNLVFEIYKYTGKSDYFNLESCVCFANINDALNFLSKHLNGKGLVRPQFSTNQKIYSSLEEYERELKESEIEMNE